MGKSFGRPEHCSQGGYEASFGSDQNNDAHTFTFHVEGALVRTLIAKICRARSSYRASSLS